MRPRASTLLFALTLGASAVAEAQAPTGQETTVVEDPAEAGREGAATTSVSEPTIDLFDLIRQLRHKPQPPPPGPDEYKKR